MLDINKNEEVDCATLMQRNTTQAREGVVVEKMSNAEFAKANLEFRSACADASILATPRQAAKWRRGEGRVFLNAVGTRAWLRS